MNSWERFSRCICEFFSITYFMFLPNTDSMNFSNLLVHVAPTNRILGNYIIIIISVYIFIRYLPLNERLTQIPQYLLITTIYESIHFIYDQVPQFRSVETVALSMPLHSIDRAHYYINSFLREFLLFMLHLLCTC